MQDTREQHSEVQDDGGVDKKLKDRIINARERVDEREDLLYTLAPIDTGYHMGERDPDQMWGMVVKQFLRTIEPILRSDEIEDAEKYYENVELGYVELVPRDVDGYPFSQVAAPDFDPQWFKIQYDLPRDVDLPEPKTIPFNGLKSVIDNDPVVSKEWTVNTDMWSVGGDAGVIHTADVQAIPRDVYETAVRHADEFLQQAGVGLDIGGDPHGYT